MAARQLWAFLTSTDVQRLVGQIEARDPGLIVSAGRYLRGDAQDLKLDPAALERREALPGETRMYLFHRKYSTDIVTHVQPAGPFEGWAQIDEERSDCLVLQLKDAPQGELEPARLYCFVTFWRGGDKLRKRPLFSIWAAQTLKWVGANLGRASVKFIHLGDDAGRLAREGNLRLTYLYRTIAPG